MSLADTPVDKNEILSRFILYSKWIRGDNTIRPEAFVPHPHIDLSVTRQKNITESKLWELGNDVAVIRNRILHGRADIAAESIFLNRLIIEPSEPPLNHANIKGFPEEKSEQKLIAMELASKSEFIANR
jgi:hypothetical protein